MGDLLSQMDQFFSLGFERISQVGLDSIDINAKFSGDLFSSLAGHDCEIKHSGLLRGKALYRFAKLQPDLAALGGVSLKPG